MQFVRYTTGGPPQWGVRRRDFGLALVAGERVDDAVAVFRRRDAPAGQLERVEPLVDEHLDPNALDVTCRVNGEIKQDSNTEQFIFGVEDLVEYISGVTTLRPGDVISTGTPGGIGIFREPPELLERGDTVEVEGVDTLTNPVRGEDPAR